MHVGRVEFDRTQFSHIGIMQTWKFSKNLDQQF